MKNICKATLLAITINFSINAYAACSQVDTAAQDLQKWIRSALSSSASIGCPATDESSSIYKLESISKESRECSQDAEAALIAFYSIFANNPNYTMCGFSEKLPELIANAAEDGKICSGLTSLKLRKCFSETVIAISSLKMRGDLKSALTLAKKSSHSNDVTGYSQMLLGYMYYYGEGVGRDITSAIKWFKVALEKVDDTESRIKILTALGVSHEALGDYQAAKNYYEQCASMGDNACDMGLIRLK